MNEQLRHRLAAIYDRLELTGRSEFLFAGERFLAPNAASVSSGQSAADGLRQELTRVLYVCAYARSFDGKADAARSGKFEVDPQFTWRLAQANQSQHEWDLAWSILDRGADGTLSVQKGHRARTVRLGEYMWADATAPDAAGNTVHLPIHHQLTSQPGFFIASGDNLPDDFDSSRVRFYFHCTSESAVSLLEKFSTALNRYEIPFYFKCLAAAQAYDRQDAAVLLIARRYFDLVLRFLDELPKDLLAGLGSTVPLFSREILPGVGLAEDPGYGESFGQCRCRLLAESALAAAEHGRHDTASRLKFLERRFVAEGLQPDRPHLIAGSTDFNLSPHRQSRATTAAAPKSMTRFFEVAAQIGRRVARDALWAGDQCNWFGVFHAETQSHRSLVRAAHGPGLWEGTAGIGLFLARLYTHTNEPLHRETAIGALVQAAAGVASLDVTLRLNFQQGALGIVYALAMAAADLDCPRLRDRATGILRAILVDIELESVVEQIGDSLVNSAVTKTSDPVWPCYGKPQRAESWQDFSLGTGLAGQCDLLATAAVATGRTDLRQQAEAIGDWGIQFVAGPRVPWPCPSGNGDEAYNLRAGQSGIGSAYLRLHDPQVPSCLIVARAELTG